jgi:hypothetical protein
MSNSIAIYVIVIGIFSLAVAIFNWDWAFRVWGSELEKVLGRKGTRWLYTVIGVIGISYGLFNLLKTS